ncbi:MAG TPA: hypothetical protein VK449_01510 [Anaerolineales bacterium]|nr:hypothetical protein [Anaerolineales bacterium]
MDVLTVATLTVVFAGLTVAMLRTVRNRRRRVLYLIPIIVALIAIRWASYRQTWAELGLSLAAAAVVCVIWWFAYGRRLPKPTDDTIRVWTKDDPF